MARLIDVSKENVKATLEKYPYYPDEIWKFTAMTERFPDVDAVEVVRCRSCKHYERIPNSGRPMCTKFLGLSIPNADDFCSYGERKEGAD